MILALDPDLVVDFQLFCDSGSGFGSSKKRNQNAYRSVMILVLDPDQESDFQPFCDFGASKMWNLNASNLD